MLLLMPLRSTSAFGRWEKAIWPLTRWFVSPRTRWFVEGHPQLDGQLWLADRRLLYETVRARRPVHCFEIGTWKGGGSTLFISQGLFDNAAGVLHTIEVDRAMAAKARQDYDGYLPHLARHIDFHVGDYRHEYDPILARGGGVDLLFLDGAEDADETLAQFEFFLPHLHPGSTLLAHDWFTEKARRVKERLERSPEWRVETLLRPPRSVGCALATRASASESLAGR